MDKQFSYEIIDNYLPNNVSGEIENIMLKNILPWLFISNKSADKVLMQWEDIHNFQFSHMFYGDYTILSNYYTSVVKPIVEKLSPLSLIRVKGNLTTVTPEIVKYGWHTDIDNNYKHKTAIYYVNTNNGKTIFKNGLEVESIKNRIVIFDGWMEHTATSSTDTKARCVLNLNYIERSK